MRRGRRHARLVLILSVLLLGAGSRPSVLTALVAPLQAQAPTAAAGVATFDFSSLATQLDPLLRGIPAADGFPGLLEALQPLTSQGNHLGRQGRLILGFHALDLERPREAVRLLAEGGEEPGPFEDWRLWLLAETHAADGETALARQALAQLLADRLDSPLYLRALARAAELAWAQGDGDAVTRLVGRGREREARGVYGERLERLGWEAAVTSGDPRLQRVAARRLLTEFPFAAADLQVVEVFRGPDGKLEWLRILFPAEQIRRAEVLLELGLAASALITLDAVPSASRSLDWHLLRARALTADHRGREALELLERAPVATVEDRAQVAWAQGVAALERARTRRGGESLGAPQRAELRQRGIEYLENVVAITGDRDLAVSALRRLFQEHAAEERVERAVEALVRLRAFAPDDNTGGRFLWERGWQEYQAGRHGRAIALWAVLADRGAGEPLARQALYWSARAHDALGERSRAREIYREVAAADSTDFYRRHALARLGESAGTGSPWLLAAEPWPHDPALGRARFFTEAGLHRLALAELELMGSQADRRAAAAIEGLALARSGQVRQSMGPLRRAFPALATPHQASVPPDAMQLYYPLLFTEPIRHWSHQRGLPVPLVLGVVRQESAFDAGAISRSGARGLMQVMPATARELAGKLGLPYSVDRLYDPDYSVRLGTSYLRQMLDMFDGNVELALAGYNAGPYRIRRLWREATPRGEIDRFIEGLQMEEPRNYVKRIVLLADSYERLYPEEAGLGAPRAREPRG